jgi:hypothetical protein
LGAELELPRCADAARNHAGASKQRLKHMVVSNDSWRIIAFRQWLGCRETARLAPLSPSSVQQPGIALCGESLLVISSNFLEMELSQESVFSRSDHPGALQVKEIGLICSNAYASPKSTPKTF